MPLLHCCEDCRAFRRREDGWPICMTVMNTVEERTNRDRALRACNALNRCRLFTPLASTDKSEEEER